MTAVLERPGLIIIGPGRSGTTALFEAMNRHPDIAGSKVKETFYFTRGTIAFSNVNNSSINEYRELFFDEGTVTLEATPAYFLGGKQVAKNIDSELENYAVICILRDPIQRFYSLYQHVKSKVIFDADLSIDDFISLSRNVTMEQLKWDENALHFSGKLESDYCFLIKEWLKVIKKENFYILDYDDLDNVEYLNKELEKVFSNVGITHIPFANLGKTNQSSKYRSMTLQRFVQKLNMRMEPFFNKFPLAKRAFRMVYIYTNGNSRAGISAYEKKAIESYIDVDFLELKILLEREGYEVPKWLSRKVND
jgi:hypothetical protein